MSSVATFNGSLALENGSTLTGNIVTDTLTFTTSATYEGWTQPIGKGIGGSASTTPGDTPTVAPSTGIVFDTPGTLEGITQTGDNRGFVVSDGGVYWISWAVVTLPNSTGSQFGLYVGNTYVPASTGKAGSTTAFSTGATVSILLVPNDTISLRNSSSTATIPIGWASLSIKGIGVGPGNNSDELLVSSLSSLSVKTRAPIDHGVAVSLDELLATSATFHAPFSTSGTTSVAGGITTDTISVKEVLSLDTFPVGRAICGSVGSSVTQTVALNANVLFNETGFLAGVTANTSAGTLTVSTAGIYEIRGEVAAQASQVFALRVGSSTTVVSAKSDDGPVTFIAVASIPTDGVVTIVNTAGSVSVISASLSLTAVGLV